MIHYETDGPDEICPPWHFEFIPCPLCAARARIAELEGERDKLLGALECSNASAKRRGERIAELEADKRRLEYLIETGYRIVSNSLGMWFVFADDAEVFGGTYPGPREMLDAAMEA